MRRIRGSAFTLVELLVVIGIIGILASILLPAISKARGTASALKCSSNLHSIGEAMSAYLAENKFTFPAAYIYNGMRISGGVQTPDAAVAGYVHWSSFLYGSRDRMSAGGSPTGPGANNIPAFMSTQGWEAFECPSIDGGGLPPTNTYAENRDSGQTNDDGATVVDFQAPRCAYTVNEAILPRNKFVVGFQGAKRAYQYVKATMVKNPGQTILATEWNQDWHLVSAAGRGDSATNVVKSHRPVHGFKGIAGGLDMDQISAGGSFGRTGQKSIRRVTVNDLAPNPKAGDASSTRLDWVGRNHGSKGGGKGGVDNRTTNFLYVDGHVETKSIRDTIIPFEWGQDFYSLQNHSDVYNQ